MAVEINKYGNYGNFNLRIGQDAAKKASESKQQDDVKETESQVSSFRGLENEIDLITKNVPNQYGVSITRYTALDKDIADDTNKILASLGYANYKVTPEQVASVANGVKTVVTPGMKLAEDGVVAYHIANPDSPFADLFAPEA